jgi:hypothetical protein
VEEQRNAELPAHCPKPIDEHERRYGPTPGFLTTLTNTSCSSFQLIKKIQAKTARK